MIELMCPKELTLTKPMIRASVLFIIIITFLTKALDFGQKYVMAVVIKY